MTDMMRALIYQGPRNMVVKKVPMPTLDQDEVLIRVSYSGICGSELSGYEGKNSLRKPPLIMGHEFSGQIVELGSNLEKIAPHLKPDQSVTVNPLISCRQCNYCLSGRQQLCPERKLMSASLPGSNAEYVAVRADAVYPLPDGMDLAIASLTEPAACVVHAVKIARPLTSETALVIGAGPIGLLTIQELYNAGAKQVYVAEINEARLDMATALRGLPIQLQHLERTSSVDIVMDAVGSEVTRQASLKTVNFGGRIIWVGLHQTKTEFDVNDTIRREIAMYGSFAYNPVDFQQALEAIEEGRLFLQSAWTSTDSLANGSARFEELIAGSSLAKIWLQPSV